MFQITILFLYLLAAGGFAASRLPGFSARRTLLSGGGFALGIAALLSHGSDLYLSVLVGNELNLSLADTVSLIGWQLALIGILGAIVPVLRGMTAGLLVLAALGALRTGLGEPTADGSAFTWQIQTHILISMFAYGLLTAGAIVAVYALVQDRRLRAGRLTPLNNLFAPLETTERLLFAITTAGFAGLLLAVVSGFTFIENLFAQHLIHKTALSLLALLLFGVLLCGRWLAGWRGRGAVYLYLGGFAILGLAYFGSRFVLEGILGRTWG